MRLKEAFKSAVPFVSNLGTNSFKLTNNKESIKTPHYIMDRVLEMLENKPNLSSGLKQYCNFLLNDISFTSSDEKSVVFATEWFDMRKNLKQEIFKFVFLLVGCGTSYFEPTYVKGKKGLILDNLFTAPDPSKIYKNLDADSDENYWIIELPREVRHYDGMKLTYWPVQYVHNSFLFRRLVWGIGYNRNKLWQYKVGWSRTNDYGYGALSTAVDNEDTQREILKNWALIAKYRSLSKKIIGFYNDNGESVDMTEIDDIKEQFDTMEEEDSLLINKKFVSEDLTFNGTDNMMGQEMEYLRKDTGSSLVPNYMTAFSQDSSMATAAEAKVPFALDLKSTQETITNYLMDAIIEPLKKEYDFLADDLEIVLKEPNLYSRNEEFMNISQMYNLRTATFNELRNSGGLSTVEGGDLWGEEPPLDNLRVTTTKDATMTEAFKKRQKIIKGLKEFLKKPEVGKRKEPKMVFKKMEETKKDKDKSFKEAVKEVVSS